LSTLPFYHALDINNGARQANRAFRKSSVYNWVLLQLLGVGLGVGTMVTTATYIFFQWRQYEISTPPMSFVRSSLGN
jgi:hypothetical protein